MRLIVVRHGQTPCNIENIWHGWEDCELTEIGVAQAEAVGRRLATEHIDVVYSSPSRRARRTGEEIMRHHDLTSILEPRLRERHAGEYEGVPAGEIEAANPAIWDERAADWWNWRPPGGESFQEVLDRTLAVVDDAAAAHRDVTVLFATHMGPARVLVSRFAGVPLGETYEMPFPSTSISIYRLEGDRVEIELLNDASHIGE